MSLYKILGVEESATTAEIKAAYKKLAQSCHPDKHKGDKDAVELFKRIVNAYKVLHDPVTRKNYDETGSQEITPVESQARSLIAQAMAEYVEKLISSNNMQSVKFTPLVNHFAECLASSERAIHPLKSRLKKLEKIRGRVKLINCGDLYDGVVDGLMERISMQLSSTENEIEIYKRANEILEGYEVDGENTDTPMTMKAGEYISFGGGWR